MIPHHLAKHVKSLNLKRTMLERNIELFYLFLVIFQIISIYYYWDQMPDVIPTHFDINGNPDGFGSKNFLFAFPGASIFILILIQVAYKFPRFLNMPWKLDEQNIERHVKHVWRLMLIIEGLIIVLMTFLCHQSIRIAIRVDTTLGYTPLILIVLLLSSIIWYFKKGYSIR